MRRRVCDLSALTAPLAAPSAIGTYLRYEPVYDDIREARRADDENLSRGIWETELKRSDWHTVEELCTGALAHKSKDLQIAGWLIEAWLHLDGLDGLKQGLSLYLDLARLYWEDIYPDRDKESRILAVEWVGKMLAEQLPLIPLAEVMFAGYEQAVTVADWRYAKNLERISRRSRQDGNKAIAEAQAGEQPTLARFQTGLRLIAPAVIEDLQRDVAGCCALIADLQSFIDTRLGNEAPSFNVVLECLREIDGLCRIALDRPDRREAAPRSDQSDAFEDMPASQDPPTPRQETAANEPQEVADRSAVYRAIADIAGFLESIDPHSITPQLLRMIAGWESKTLPEILTALSELPPATKSLIKMLANGIG